MSNELPDASMTQSTRRLTFLLAALFCSAAFITPSLHAQDNSSVLAEIGDYELTLGEYERQFLRNNGGDAAALASTPEERLHWRRYESVSFLWTAIRHER